MAKLPKGLTLEHVVEAVEADENAGFCLKCGDDAYGVEPDACNYECESCGAEQVFGAEEILLMFA